LQGGHKVASSRFATDWFFFDFFLYCHLL